AGEPRVFAYATGGVIDAGAYELQPSGITPDGEGIVYVKEGATGDGSGWAAATGNLQGAIDAAGTQQVWVAVGNYDVPTPNSFVMKNGVAIYGGFDPDNGIADRDDERILPNRGTAEGSVLNGKGE